MGEQGGFQRGTCAEGVPALRFERRQRRGRAEYAVERDQFGGIGVCRADAYYWQDVCGWLNGQPEKERVLAAGGWDVLVGAADFPMAQDKIG